MPEISSPRELQAAGEDGPGRSTIKDVARVAAVSFKTVSRVLNDEPHVSAALRLRVIHAVEQLGFERNEAAASLRRRPRESYPADIQPGGVGSYLDKPERMQAGAKTEASRN